MRQLINFKRGLEIIDPFLKQHNFEFHKFENSKDSEDEYTIASYKYERKQFLIDYRFSIGQVLYQFDNSIVSHPFYLDQLGFADKKKLTYFLSEDKPEAYKHILHDFKFLADDFFKGGCIKLKEFAKLQDNIITNLYKKIRKENTIRTDNIKIDKARMEFRKKEFKKSIEIYKAVEDKNLLSELDNNIIAFCKRHL